MNKTESLDIVFMIYVYTDVNESKQYLKLPKFSLPLLVEDSEFQDFFGEDADWINNCYQNARSYQLNVIKATLEHELQQNFNVYYIGNNDNKNPFYIYSDTRSALILSSIIEYEVGLEIPQDPSGHTRADTIQEFSKIIEVTLQKLEGNLGVEARCGDILSR